ncbi:MULTISPECIES: class A beta-lactamase [Streptomyces]|uniref:Beta-lactamase n=1 Tax=Streptomyces luteosporeus TaxID=173856 RepID=A0ABN3TPN0_9ACTN
MTSITRRNVLTLGAGATLATVLAGSGTAHAAGGNAARRLAALERAHGARLGVYAHNVRTGRTVAHSADELFPMCSTFKTLAVAAVLRDLDRDGEFLAKRIHYTAQDVIAAENSKITERPANIAHGMTVEELCAAAISFSDNCAANLLLRELGGPAAVTRFARSLGDRVTRLDRWEPALNTAEPDRVTDTTTPYAIGRTYARLVLGDALATADRRRLMGWLLGNTTSDKRFRKGIPAGWRVADKTGGGSYGTNNDVGVVWTPQGAPVVMAVLTTHPRDRKAQGDDELIAQTVAVLADTLG